MQNVTHIIYFSVLNLPFDMTYYYIPFDVTNHYLSFDITYYHISFNKIYPRLSYHVTSHQGSKCKKFLTCSLHWEN